MEVIIVSDTVQKFNGESYYKCGFYFQRKGKRLHREVWKYHNGDIPKGYHVHHKDADRSNNSIENLVLIEGRDHLSEHMSKEERRARSREDVKKAIQEAPKWHRSDAGKEWHSLHQKETWKHVTPHAEKCAWCGKEFTTRDMAHKNCDRYCCNNHKASALRWRRKHEGKVDYPGRESRCIQP